jgi:AAA family ATPase
LQTTSKNVVLIGATNRIEAVDAALRRPGRFDREIEVTIPSAEERTEILSVLLRDVPNMLSHSDIVSIAHAAHGYVGGDLSAICREAGSRALSHCLEGVEIDLVRYQFF